MSNILLITPPFVQPNTPYPATAYLKGFLKSIDIDSRQVDLSLNTLLALFSKKGLEELFASVDQLPPNASPETVGVWRKRNEYIDTIEEVIAFLQGKSRTLAYAICETDYLPNLPEEDPDEMEWAFGVLGQEDRARFFATRYLEELTRFIQECVDERFGFSRYAEQLGRYAGSFDELNRILTSKEGFIDRLIRQELHQSIGTVPPEVVLITIPFAGNLYSALRIGAYLKSDFPNTTVIMGGGFVSTELRQLSDRRLFDYCDYVVLDDGEETLPPLLHYIYNKENEADLVRCFRLNDTRTAVIYTTTDKVTPVPQSERGTPSYEGLPMDRYISLIERLNPMHKLWSDGRWLKLTLAHGCYWAKCSFCDCTLDYIGRYQPDEAMRIVDRMETLIRETGERGFHFVDEAAPPALLRSLSEEILRRGLKVVWWGNVRFEKSFTASLCELMKKAGCIAVSGGVEVASERILRLINKGVDLPQVAQVTRSFTESGIMVHAYLMYGFPTQTAQETIDSLEVVRQLFEEGYIQSAFWHRFALTTHSPVGQDPKAFDIRILETPFEGFARNDLDFEDPKGCDHGQFGEGLRISLYNYMNGTGFDLPLQRWFSVKVPHTQLPPNYIRRMGR